MVDKIRMNKNDLRTYLDTLFVFASQVSYNNDHLFPIINASKSLIGLDLNRPPQKLLKWLENYIKNFVPDYDMTESPPNIEIPQFISYSNMSELIMNKDHDKAHKYLASLIRVADVLPIVELAKAN